jgi:hypothetical protein
LFIIGYLTGLTLNYPLRAQTPKQNLDKYWHYRYRLTHYFESVGMGQGQSLPASERNGG